MRMLMTGQVIVNSRLRPRRPAGTDAVSRTPLVVGFDELRQVGYYRTDINLKSG